MIGLGGIRNSFQIETEKEREKGTLRTRNVSCTGIARCRLILIRCEKY